MLAGRVAARLDGLLNEIVAKNDWEIVACGVMSHNVHAFVPGRTSDSPAEVARMFMARTSRVLWLESIFAASVGFVSEQTVRSYIEHYWDEAA